MLKRLVIHVFCMQFLLESLDHLTRRKLRFTLYNMNIRIVHIEYDARSVLLGKAASTLRRRNLKTWLYSVADPCLGGRGGVCFFLMALPAFLLSVICSLFIQNRGVGEWWGWTLPLDPPLSVISKVRPTVLASFSFSFWCGRKRF